MDITPSKSVELAGFRCPKRFWRTVEGNIEANAVLLRRQHRRIIFVQVDVLSVGEYVKRRVLQKLDGRLAPDELFLVASHTHFAPNIDPRLTELGGFEEEYAAFVTERITDLLNGVLSAKAERVRIRYGQALAAHSVNRRAWCLAPALRLPPVKRVMALHPNPEGPKDEALRLIAMARHTDDTEPAAVLWNYACHPVATNDYYAISPDYPGAVRRALRTRFGLDMPVVFLPGFTGNLRPCRIDHLPISPYYLLRRIINGPVFGKYNARSYKAWTRSLAAVALSALTSVGPTLDITAISCHRYSQPLHELMYGELDDRLMTYQAVILENAFMILGISAEPVIEYAAYVRRLFPEYTLLPVGYLDGVCGYLPTSGMIGEGGMEVTSPGYSLDEARYQASISETVLGTIGGLVGKGHAPDPSKGPTCEICPSSE